MKKHIWICYVASICFCVAGAVFRDRFNVADILFMVSGVVLFLVAFACHCMSMAKRCPNCNAIIHTGHIRTIVRQKNGMIKCEKCGSLVRVKYN